MGDDRVVTFLDVLRPMGQITHWAPARAFLFPKQINSLVSRDGGFPMSVQPTAQDLLADSSDTSIWFISIVSGAMALGGAISIQWLVYDDWLHDAGPLRLAGSVLAGLFLGALVFRSRRHAREKRRRMVEHLHAIRWTNDRIRNSLQAIECVTFAAAPQIAEDVKNSVDSIEHILNDLLVSPNAHGAAPRKSTTKEVAHSANPL
jgi:hypothetical protein